MDFQSQAIKSLYLQNKHDPNIGLVIEFLNNKYAHKTQFNFSYKEAVIKAKEWAAKDKKRISHMGKIKKIADLGDGFTLVHLLNFKAKHWESLHMRHCVATHYQTHKGIYSVRDPLGIPVCTIEVNFGEVSQIKGINDNPVYEAFVPYCLKAVKKLAWRRVNSTEFQNIHSFKGKVSFLKEHFYGVQYMWILNQRVVLSSGKWSVKKRFTANPGFFKSFDQHDKDLGAVLSYLCRTGKSPEAVENLIKIGTKVNVGHFASVCGIGDLKTIDVFFNLMPFQHSMCVSGSSEAIRSGNVEVLLKIIHYAKDNWDYVATDLIRDVLKYGSQEIRKAFVQNSGPQVVYDLLLESCDERDSFVFNKILKLSNIKEIKELDGVGSSKTLLIDEAARMGNEPLVRKLISLGFKIAKENGVSQSLISAVQYGSKELALTLLKAGARNDNALLVACAYDHQEIVSNFISVMSEEDKEKLQGKIMLDVAKWAADKIGKVSGYNNLALRAAGYAENRKMMKFLQRKLEQEQRKQEIKSRLSENQGKFYHEF